MSWIKGLIKILGGVSFAIMLFLIYIVAPLGLLFLILSEPVSRFTAALPATSSNVVYSGGIMIIVVGLVAVAAYGIRYLLNR